MAGTKRSRTRSRGSAATPKAIRDSAQKIWLAGLGAFERARSEGPRVFEALVEQGRGMGARAVGAADQALRNMRHASYGGVQWDKLEKVFEERVSRSLKRLGVLTREQVDDLSRQVAELNKSLRAYAASAGKAAAGGGARRKTRAGTRKRAAARRGGTRAKRRGGAKRTRAA